MDVEFHALEMQANEDLESLKSKLLKQEDDSESFIPSLKEELFPSIEEIIPKIKKETKKNKKRRRMEIHID